MGKKSSYDTHLYSGKMSLGREMFFFHKWSSIWSGFSLQFSFEVRIKIYKLEFSKYGNGKYGFL